MLGNILDLYYHLLQTLSITPKGYLLCTLFHEGGEDVDLC